MYPYESPPTLSWQILRLLAAIVQVHDESTPKIDEKEQVAQGPPGQGSDAGEREEGGEREPQKAIDSTRQEPPEDTASRRETVSVLKEGLLEKKRHKAGWTSWTKLVERQL